MPRSSRIILLLSFVIFILTFLQSDVYSRENYQWNMILPSVTNQCRPGNLSFCKNQQICESRKGYWYQDSCHSQPEAVCETNRLDLCTTLESCGMAGGYWYGESCHSEPETLVCGPQHLDLCFTEQECTSMGGFWYELQCNQSQSPNAVETAKLAGDWYFVMNFGQPDTFQRTYSLNKDTIKEDPPGSGKFIISGTDENNDEVVGSYVPINHSYTMSISKTDYDILYEFSFSSTLEVNGCYYTINKLNKQMSSCTAMTGEKF